MNIDDPEVLEFFKTPQNAIIVREYVRQYRSQKKADRFPEEFINTIDSFTIRIEDLKALTDFLFLQRDYRREILGIVENCLTMLRDILEQYEFIKCDSCDEEQELRFLVSMAVLRKALDDTEEDLDSYGINSSNYAQGA